MPEVAEKVSAYEVLREYNSKEAPGVLADLEAEQRMRERNFSIPQEMFRIPSVTLCSVWPEPLVSKPFTHWGMGRYIYTMDAGSPEKPSYLTVHNAPTRIQTQVGSQEIGLLEVSIVAASIAIDLIQDWTGDHPGNIRGKKGIGVIKGSEATPAEIKNLTSMQDGFLRFLVDRADEYNDNGKREKIHNEHRRALQMLGLDLNMHPWYRSKVQLYNTCPRCAEKILIEANFCKHCHTDLVKYFMDIGEVPSGDAWPTVVKQMDRLTKKGAPKNAAQ